jgi:hypothetical protein
MGHRRFAARVLSNLMSHYEKRQEEDKGLDIYRNSCEIHATFYVLVNRFLHRWMSKKGVFMHDEFLGWYINALESKLLKLEGVASGERMRVM